MTRRWFTSGRHDKSQETFSLVCSRLLTWGWTPWWAQNCCLGPSGSRLWQNWKESEISHSTVLKEVSYWSKFKIDVRRSGCTSNSHHHHPQDVKGSLQKPWNVITGPTADSCDCWYKSACLYSQNKTAEVSPSWCERRKFNYLNTEQRPLGAVSESGRWLQEAHWSYFSQRMSH